MPVEFPDPPLRVLRELAHETEDIEALRRALLRLIAYYERTQSGRLCPYCALDRREPLP